MYNSPYFFVELEKNSGVDRLLLDYLKEGGTYPEARRVNRDDSLKKRISSPFRERLEEDREKQLEEVAQNYLANSDNDEDENYDEEEYSELIRELLDKYKNYPVRYNRPRVYLNGETRNKRYYPMFISETNLRKRNKYHSSEEPAYYNPYSNDEYYDSRFQEDDQWYPNIPSKRNRRQKLYPVKRFPVSKRSGPKSEIIHEHKRSTTKKESAKTDPKVAKDLSNIFGTVATEKPTTTKMEKVINKPKKEKTKPSKTEERSPVNTKEEVPVPQQDKPIEIKKKSIDWSDYFGLDRRKKSENNLDNEWLMERYHKAVSLNSKRTAEYALQSFKNHDEPTKKESSVRRLDPSFAADESKLAEMNKKLKKMEDAIIDDALKYTGAHQGTSDSQEIQEVKDRVISRLAAAYNLEKMRRALGEYKLSMAQERQKFAQQSKDKDNYDISEEKRVSVPRKQAVDDEREKLPEGDNDIKCSQGDENCEEQNYRTPPEVLEQTTFGKLKKHRFTFNLSFSFRSFLEECPKVQRACSEVATVLGYYARVFETACNMHQMCLLCVSFN